MRNGVRKIIRKPIISSILFFHSTTLRAMEIQRQFTDKVILYTRDKELKKVPLIIPDRKDEYFHVGHVIRQERNGIFGADSTKFCRGERVRVIDGKFKGAEGYICRIKKNSRLVVAIQGVCAVATSYIPQSFIQKYENDNRDRSFFIGWFFDIHFTGIDTYPQYLVDLL